MKKVLIKESDIVYHWALQIFVIDHFRQRNDEAIIFLDNAGKAGMEDADIIIYGFRPGEILTCIPEFKTTKAVVVMGIYTQDRPEAHLLPSCFQSMTLIHRSGSVEEYQSILSKASKPPPCSARSAARKGCVGCLHKELSHQQRQVFVEIGKGKSAEQIASELAITVKTVLSHKHLAMRKFNLNSDQQLLQFLSLSNE
uniref:HTH luxR-type domain-containing protein n=1 Tax=termite gut metagenome TaxID=433724 RepID=S0DGJ8_9ZZZZ